MTVEIVSGLKGKERGHAHRHRPQRLVADVEVVMREAAALPSQDAVVGIVGGKAGNRGAEGLALLHAFQNEVHPMLPGPFHAAQGGTNIILLAYLRLGPFEGGVVARKRLHPCLILVGSPRQHFLGDHRLANHVLKEIRHLTRPRQTAQITVDHHTVKTVVYKKKQAAKQLGERLHRSSSSGLVMTTRSSNGRPVEANFKYVCLVFTDEADVRQLLFTLQPVAQARQLVELLKTSQFPEPKQDVGGILTIALLRSPMEQQSFKVSIHEGKRQEIIELVGQARQMAHRLMRSNLRTHSNEGEGS